MYKITICANAETILDSYETGSISAEMLDDIASSFVENVETMIRAASLAGVEVDYETSNQFSAYHGGKFAEQAKMYGQTGGLVSCNDDAPQIVIDLCEKARLAALTQVEKEIEEEIEYQSSFED